jgi:hypothetical protein
MKENYSLLRKENLPEAGRFTYAEMKKNETGKAVKILPEKKETLKHAEKELYSLESCKDIYTEISKTDEETALNEKIKTEAGKLCESNAEKKRKLEEQTRFTEIEGQ